MNPLRRFVQQSPARELDRSVVNPNQIRTVLQTYKDRVFTELFPDRTGDWLPKTLIFAKDDNHAEEIVHAVREVFGEGNDFAKKITYRNTGEDPKSMIKAFRVDPFPGVALTVDMIATGTDIKPVEVLIFMRDVKSEGYYEQMKGRGARMTGQRARCNHPAKPAGRPAGDPFAMHLGNLRQGRPIRFGHRPICM